MKHTPSPHLTGVCPRRGLARLAMGALAMGFSIDSPARAEKAKHLVFACAGRDAGRDWANSLQAAWLDPFANVANVPVQIVTDRTYERLRAMVRSGHVEWDVVEVTPDVQWLGARDDVLEKLDFSIIDRRNLMAGSDLITDYSVADVLWSHVMFCNTQQFAEGRQPQNWAGVWNLNGFPGKRCFPATASGGALEAALLADGVAPTQLYPLDLDRALQSLNRIKDHIVWWTSDAQSQQIMLAGQAVLGLVTDRQALAAIDLGAQIAIQYNQSLLTWSALVVPKGAPNRMAAMALINYVLTPEAQAAIAMADTFGPVTPAAFEQLPPHRAGMLSGGPQQEGRSLWVNEHWWMENRASVTAKFDAWRAG